MGELLTVQEVAERLKVSAKTVRRWIQEGRLSAVRAGSLWRVREEALDAFLERNGGDGENGETEEDRAWLEEDLGGELPPYDWGPNGPPKGKPVRYVPGVGPVVEGGKRG
ncbi:MAG: helix-turn-helix domain-containing protein [Clostridia bacterium]|nr:helix-turn-helix domain-containing protein [Clostridia bacterium]